MTLQSPSVLGTPTNRTSSCALPDARVAEVVDLHFDPERGSAFWLERAKRLDFDPRERVRTAADLPLLGSVERDALLRISVWDLVPRSLHGAAGGLLLSETGGTTGRPLRCVYTADEFRHGFADPFAAAARERGFPTRGTWLFVGPSGPHVIHRAARAFAQDGGALEPFSVDFDPRWARAQTPGSVGARAYREHVIDQALGIVERERPDLLFSTPPVLQRLAEELDAGARERVRGIHVGGMALAAPEREALCGAFPRAVVLPAYGNSLAGIAPELVAPAPGEPSTYAVPAGRMRLRVDAPPGERGRIVLDRVDRTVLLPNLVERDEAVAVPAPRAIRDLGFAETMLFDPAPAAEVPVAGGLY